MLLLPSGFWVSKPNDFLGWYCEVEPRVSMLMVPRYSLAGCSRQFRSPGLQSMMPSWA